MADRARSLSWKERAVADKELTAEVLTSEEENESFWERLVAEDRAAEGTKGSGQAESLCVDEASDEAAPTAEMTFEEAVERLATAVQASPLHREMCLRLLEFCQTQRTLEEAEQEVESYPEYQSGAQPAYRLIRTMVDRGGLELIELAEDGSRVLPEDKAGLGEDEVDDLVAGFAVLTTVVGEQVLDRLSAEKRLRDLFEREPRRSKTYLEVMEFCKEPRTYQEVHDLLQGKDVLSVTANADGRPLQPSFFLDMLERSGGLVWDGGWKVTRKGEALLGRMLQPSA